MKTYQFKTNIMCSSCIAKVTPHLDEAEGIKEWAVDTANPKKILTVQTDNLDEKEVVAVVNKAGYKAESL